MYDLKVSVWSGIMHHKIIGPFFFAEKSVTTQIYLNVLPKYMIPHLEGYQLSVIFKQDGAPPHWSHEADNL